MSEWQETTLGQVLTLEYGKALRAEDRAGVGFPVLGSNGVVGYHTQPLVKGPGIVVGRKGSAGSVTFVDDDFHPIDTAYFVRLNEGSTMMFAALLLEHANLPAICAQTGVPGLNRDRVYELPALLPSFSEQQRIVDLIGAVDTQIAALLAETGLATAAYQSALTWLWLNHEGLQAPLRPLSDVMTIDIERVTLADAATYRSAGVLGSGQGLIDKGSFRGGDVAYSTMNVMRTDQVIMRKLTAWEGPITVVPASFDGFVASAEFPTFTLGDEASPDWMRHVCRTPRLMDEMKSRVTGSVQRRKRLSPDHLLEVRLPIPPLKVQEHTAAGLDVIDSAITAALPELGSLRRFRAALLTAVLSREVEIPDAYNAVLEAAV